MENYSYSAEDKSLLTPLLYKFFVFPFVKLLPLSLPANIITICSNSLVFLSFILAYINYCNDSYRFLWLIPVLCWLYIIGDCSDGIQARRTKTGSPLGEYFDHFLDSFVTGLLTGTLMLTCRLDHSFLLFAVYQFLYIGQIGTFWGRFKAGVMQFSKFSTSEGTMAIAIMTFLYSFDFTKTASRHNIIFGFGFPQLIMITAYAAAAVTGFVTIFKTKKLSIRLFLHIALSSMTGAIFVFGISSSILMHTIIITFYNVLFIESVLSSTSQKTKEAHPDYIVPISTILFFVMPQYMLTIQIIQSIYLFIRIAIRFIIFFNKYKYCWYWKNPPIIQLNNKK